MTVTIYNPGCQPVSRPIDSIENAARRIFEYCQFGDSVFVIQNNIGIITHCGMFEDWKEEQFPGHQVEV